MLNQKNTFQEDAEMRIENLLEKEIKRVLK